MKNKATIFIAIAIITLSSCNQRDKNKEFELSSKRSLQNDQRIDTAFKGIRFGISKKEYESGNKYEYPDDIIDLNDSKAIGGIYLLDFGKNDSLNKISLKYTSDKDYITGNTLAIKMELYFAKRNEGSSYISEEKNGKTIVKIKKSNLDILLEGEKKSCFITITNINK